MPTTLMAKEAIEMGSKRKPFVTTKAISEVIIRSGESCDWPSSHIQEIWQLASMCRSLCRERGKPQSILPSSRFILRTRTEVVIFFYQ